MNCFPVMKKDILLIIKSLDSTKIYKYSNVSLKKIKICSESDDIPLKINFKKSLKKEYFEKYGKKKM